MKPFRKLFSLCLALVLLCLCCPVGVSAESQWTNTQLEQYSTVLPEVNAYLYPLDAKGDVFFDAGRNWSGIKAQLDTENLEIKSFEPVKDIGSTYILLVNVTFSSASHDYLKQVKEEIKVWLDSMGKHDRLMLLAYADDFELLLDGSEAAGAAKVIVDGMETEARNPDTIAAIKEGIRLADTDNAGLPERRVLVLMDNGLFLDKSSNIQKELQASLSKASLPLYVLCNSGYEKVQKEMQDFASQSGGKSFDSMAFALKDAAEDVRTWINSCFVLKMCSKSNDPEPRERSLKISLPSNKAHTVEKNVNIQGSIADKDAPRIQSVTWEGTEVSVAFTEYVTGADKLENYAITDAKEKAVTISTVEYDPENAVAKLTLEKELKAGDYSLKLSGIQDISAEKNSFVYEDGEAYIFTVEQKDGIDLVVAGAGLAGIAVVILLVVLSNQKKKKERLAREAAETADGAEIPVQPEVPKLHVRLCVELPNGSRNNGEIDIGQEMKVGRNRECALAINDESISGLHCILSYSGSKLVITDANSRNGTYVNKRKIETPCQLVSGDEICIGKTIINISY